MIIGLRGQAHDSLNVLQIDVRKSDIDFRLRHDTNLAHAVRMIGIAANTLPEIRHNLEFRVVATSMDIKALHIVWRTLPPFIAVTGNIVPIVNHRRLPILRAHRPIDIEAIQPGPRTIEQLPSV